MPRQASTEVVYRLYETVDELTTVIENARSVPMSGSCMVCLLYTSPSPRDS